MSSIWRMPCIEDSFLSPLLTACLTMSDCFSYQYNQTNFILLPQLMIQDSDSVSGLENIPSNLTVLLVTAHPQGGINKHAFIYI